MDRKKDLLRIIITLVAVAAIMLTIFIFSSFKREVSASQSEKITEVIVKIIYPDSVTWDNAKRETVYASTGLTVRKAAHFAEFALLGAALMLHLDAIMRLRRIRYAPMLAVAIGAFYAVTDEFHQLFVEGRGGTTEDVLIDSAGVLFGVLVVLLAVWLVARGKERKAVKAVKTGKTGNDAEHNADELNAAVHSGAEHNAATGDGEADKNAADNGAVHSGAEHNAATGDGEAGKNAADNGAVHNAAEHNAATGDGEADKRVN